LEINNHILSSKIGVVPRRNPEEVVAARHVYRFQRRPRRSWTRRPSGWPEPSGICSTPRNSSRISRSRATRWPPFHRCPREIIVYAREKLCNVGS